MTTMQELWPTVGLILLILSLVVILRRLVILTALEASRNSYAQNERRTSPDEQNLQPTGSSESHSEPVDLTSTGIHTGGVSYFEPAPEKRRLRKGKKHY